MRVVEPTESSTFRFRFRDNLGALTDVTTPTAKVIDFAGTLVGITTGGFTNVGTGIYDFELDTTDPNVGSTEGTYRLHVFGGINGVRSFADAPELFQISALDAAEQVEYSSVTGLIKYLNLNEDQNLDIEFMRLLLRSASRWEERYCQRVFYRKTEVETHFLDSERDLFLLNYPVVSLTSITIDGAAVSSDNYDLNSRIGHFKFGLAQTGEVVVTYVHGANSVPAEVELVAQKFSGFLFTRKMREGLSSEHILGYSYTLIPDDNLKEMKEMLMAFRVVRAF